MSETNFKKQSSEMIKINNKMNLRDLFRKVGFIIPSIVGLLFFCFCVYEDFIHDKTFIGRYNGYGSLTLGGVAFMFTAISISYYRWKFFYGTEEYREVMRQKHKEMPSRIVLPGGYIGKLGIIIINFVLFIAALLNHLYFISLVPIGVCIIFGTIFYFFDLRPLNRASYIDLLITSIMLSVVLIILFLS
jgi:hypothetical protein